MTLSVWQHRNTLRRTKRKLAEGALTVGFLGGSITDERPGHNWPEAVLSDLVERYPRVRFHVENAAIGATGSELGVLRSERDIVARGCDLVFVDYAVNDAETPVDRRNRSREGLLRKLLGKGRCDVVLVYTFRQEMYEAMMSGCVPDTIAEFERLAAHYGIGSVWMGLHALEEVRQGRMKWEEWLPDGLHPTSRGSLSYAHSVIKFLERELGGGATAGSAAVEAQAMPAPLYVGHWGDAECFSLADVQLAGPWTIRRSTRNVWMDQILETAAVGARLRFSFHGTGLVLGFDFGKTSAEFNYRLDGGRPAIMKRDRPGWCPDSGWFRAETIAENLTEGPHEFELEVTHGNRPECQGTTLRLTLVGVLR